MRGFWLFLCPALLGAASLRVAAFRADVTPKLGEPLIWTTPAKTVQDPLWAKGVVIEDGDKRYVLCAIDWCGLAGRAHRLFRSKLAEATGADLKRVEAHTVHQHTAPYVDSGAYELLRRAGAPVLGFTDESLEALASRVAQAARSATAKLEPFDRVGISSAEVDRVASARRLPGPDGKITVRYSNGAKDRSMAEAPEGAIDKLLRTVTLARANRVLVRLHYYATHPQTFCCEGTVSGDIVSAARESFEREENVPQIYFTGAAGDVTVGKYNDGSADAREQLSARLLDALRRSARRTEYQPVGKLAWVSVALRLPKKTPQVLDPAVPDDERCRRAIVTAFAGRKEPLQITSLRLGPAQIINLPGEPMLAFQRYAQSLRPGKFVAFAGYGDIAPGYICTDRAYEEGGYEPSASRATAGSEPVVKAAMRKALGVR